MMIFCSCLEFHLEKEPNEHSVVRGVVEMIDELGVN